MKNKNFLIIMIVLFYSASTLISGNDKKPDENEFQKYRSQLRVILKNKIQTLYNIQQSIVFKEEIDQTISVVVLEDSQSVKPLTLEKMQSWNMKLDEIYQIGIDNTIKDQRYKIIPLKLSKKVTCSVIDNISPYNTTYALLIDKYKKWTGKHGTIIGIPNETAFIFYPVKNKITYEFIDIIMPAIVGMYKEGPGPITPYLYWYYQNQYIKINYQIDDNNKIKVDIPSKLKELLK